ncbi:MAG: cystathionine beta-lyase [Candidatus Eremiobacteraeota bacterium]|nr:cystathionine beta-lyase [Candidatus Eremiobacteraeota bacterium]
MRKETLLTRVGREMAGSGPVNPAVQRASTIRFDTVAEFERAQRDRYERGTLYYGTYGTETTFAFESAVAALEGGDAAIAVSSGLAAIVATISAFVGSGEHLLVPDSVYGPVRIACEGVLRRAGIETTYYDPLAGSEIVAQIRPNTKLLYLESPGSLTFEVQDVPAIVAVAKQHGISTALDNTWATGYYFDAFARGVDVVIQAATKYVGGHSDLVLGAIVTTQAHYERMRRTVAGLGYSAAPDDCWLALRGLRTLPVRLRAHAERAIAVASYLDGRPEVELVLYPRLAGAPGHALWKRDFTGATGLFSFVFERTIPESAAIAFVERLRLFAIGASWGGYESLALLVRPKAIRSLPTWQDTGSIVRLQIGLEDAADLVDDLKNAFSTLS